MKAKLIIALFLVSLMLMPTDNIIQALIALSFLGISVRLMNKNQKEVTRTIENLENKVLNILKIK